MIMGKFTARIDGHGCLLSWNLMKWKHKNKKQKKQQMSPSEMHNTSHYKPTHTACPETNEPSSLP